MDIIFSDVDTNIQNFKDYVILAMFGRCPVGMVPHPELSCVWEGDCSRVPCVHGSCNLQPNHPPTCICDQGWSGTLCETRSNPRHHSSTGVVVIAVVVPILIICKYTFCFLL